MATTANTVTEPLPREMQQHTYAIMRRVEESHWWFVGRRQIIRSFLERVVQKLRKLKTDRGDETGIKILDVGCGTGANLELLAQFGEAEGVDVSSEALSFCHERGLVKVKQGAAEALPYADSSFDLVTGLDVVEHLDDDLAGLREMRRILTRDGRALVFVPAFMFLWGVQDDISNHRRRYTLPGLKRVLREAGFEIERASYANISFFTPILLGRLFMRATRLRPESENNITIGFLNGALGKFLGAESAVLRYLNFPFGVSIICVARRIE
ncbi:MAG TPA: methyltransferase domain-containing protein [Pyrinomonadaceae bacterium]|jgi:SAM-dependent methyltransferase|nr:methyltransferase domain-containing protein [Pyrinomonadaceae bacterium]